MIMQPGPLAPTYSVVVPVYESNRSISELVSRLRAVFENSIQAAYEIILVDDGSRSPLTWQTCERFAREYPSIVAIRLMRNYGKPGAVLCGLTHARGQFVITIDDDLQQRPEDIPALITHQSHDVVVAHFASSQHDQLTKIGSWIKRAFDRVILGLPCPMSPLKLFKAEVARGMLQIRTPYPFIPALLASVTQDFVSVVVSHETSRHGKSRYTFRRRVRQFSHLLINNSTLLLRCLGVLGVTVAFGGFVFALTVVLRRLFGAPIFPGWASLMVINLVFGGLILLALGIVGEYLIRILEGISNKPAYLIRQIVTAEGEPPQEKKDCEAALPLHSSEQWI